MSKRAAKAKAMAVEGGPPVIRRKHTLLKVDLSELEHIQVQATITLLKYNILCI